MTTVRTRATASSRDVLLARHAAAQPELDAQREALLARFACFAPMPAVPSVAEPESLLPTVPPLFSRGVFETLWRELFVPCRGAWAAFACVWVAILAIDRLDSLGSESAPAAQVARSDATWLAVWLEQRRLLADLVRDSFAPATPPPPLLPAPVVPPLGFIDSVSNPARYV